jgi:hypothetical protein
MRAFMLIAVATLAVGIVWCAYAQDLATDDQSGIH